MRNATLGAALRAAAFLVGGGAATAAGIGAALGFGSINGLGQQAEHEQITRTALGCYARNGAFAQEGLCFQPKSLNEIAGTTRTFGAVAAPDNPLNGELEKSEAHCDNSKLRECRDYMAQKMNLAVAAARVLVQGDGANSRIDDSQIPTMISCTYLRRSGRAKCNVLEELGSVLHAAQDFYAHSNWADEAAPGPITLSNPRGLNRADIAPFLNLRLNGVGIPAGLISGCFIQRNPADTKGNADCTVPSHEDLNKDKGTIDPNRFGLPADPTLTSATTTRGRIGTNFHKAVAVAVLDTRDKLRFFRERLIATYGAERGALMFCAIAHDDPKTTCPAGNRPTTQTNPPDTKPNSTAPARGCVAPFKWVGGDLCIAYGVAKPFCDSNKGRFVAPQFQGAPTRCETDALR